MREARKIANDLVRARFAACVNIVPVTSFYRWKGEIMNEREVLMIIKTKSNLFTKLKQRILALHSYQVPEMVSLKIDKGFEPYLKWLDGQLIKESKGRIR